MTVQAFYPDTDPNLERRLQLFSRVLRPDQPWVLLDHRACAALSASIRGKLCQSLAKLPRRHYRAGQQLYSMGNPARSLFMVQSGLIKTTAISEEGQELTLRLYKTGDLLGELCFCGGGRREVAVALEDSAVTEIPLSALVAQLKRDPDAALELASMVCERLTDAYEQIESLYWDTVLHRLVRALLRLANEVGEPGEAGTRLGHYIRQEELARLVGARREVVSGLLSRLRASGHISYSPRGAITVRPAALQRFLDARDALEKSC
jgi:CRP/FNR family transcriptional regulator, cyclic AMP receptor protein